MAEPINEIPSTSAADTSGVMRYDSAAEQYVYNLATKYLLDANASYTVQVRDTSFGQESQKLGVRLR